MSDFHSLILWMSRFQFNASQFNLVKWLHGLKFIGGRIDKKKEAKKIES